MNYKYYISNNNGQDDYGLKYIDSQGYADICKQYKVEFPPQHQNEQPGMEYLMTPRPIFNNLYYRASGKLINKVAIITGGVTTSLLGSKKNSNIRLRCSNGKSWSSI